MPSRAVVWFRRDLRVTDHPALLAALDAAEEVVPIFVVDHGGRNRALARYQEASPAASLTSAGAAGCGLSRGASGRPPVAPRGGATPASRGGRRRLGRG